MAEIEHSGLVDHRGRPLRQGEPPALFDPRDLQALAKAREGQGLLTPDELIEAGVHVRTDGSVDMSPEAVRRIQERLWRRATLPTTPMLPTFINKDVGSAIGRGFTSRGFMSFATLRRVRERSPIITAVHQAVEAKVRRMCRRWNGERHEVGWEVTHRQALRPDGRMPDGFEQVTRRFERFLECPSEDYAPTLEDFLVPLVEDFLTINHPVVEPLYSAMAGNVIVGWKYVDGGIIWPTSMWLERWYRKNTHLVEHFDRKGLAPRERLDLISEVLETDLRVARWVLVREGHAEVFYKRGELIVGPQHNRTDIRWRGYHPSHVEQAVELIAAFMGAFDYNANFFRNGFMPEQLLAVLGEMHPQDFQSFITQLQEGAMGVRRAHIPLVLPVQGNADVKAVQLKANSRDMAFETWLSCLIAMTCAIYREDPSSLNAKPWNGGAGSSLSEPSRMGEIQLANADGLQSLLGHMASHILTPMARRVHPDLVVRWHYGEDDPEREARVYELRSRTDLTPNEIAVLQGREPVPPFWPRSELADLSEEDRKKHDDNPWNQLLNPAFTQMMQSKQMAEQQAAMGGMGDGFGGGPSPFGDATGEYPFGAMGPGQDEPGPPGGDLRKGTAVYIEGRGIRWPKERT